MNNMRVFKHKLNGKYYRLVNERTSNINTFLEVDKGNNPVVDWREWSVMPKTIEAIIKGFDKLIEL